MKKYLLTLLIVQSTFIGWSQKTSITWGEDFKLKKGSSDISVIHTDKSGVYLEESHDAVKSYFVIGATFRESASLVKVDRNLQEIYRSDFNKELKGKSFVEFFTVKGKLLIVASEYRRSEKTHEIYGAEIDKSSGEIKETWKAITALQQEDKKDIVNFKLIPNADSSGIVVISTATGKGKNSYKVQEFDQNLKPTGPAAIVSNEFEPKTYQLEDLLYTPDKKIILVGRVFEFQEGKRKKEKFLDFANYNIRIYDASGKQLNELNTNINGKWLTSSKVMLKHGKDLILAGFYCKERKGKTIDGLLVQRIDPATGKVLSTAEQAINNSMLSDDNADTGDDNDDDKDAESKTEKKEREKLAKLKDEGEGFSKYMKFRNIFYTADNGIVLLAEYFHFFITYTSSYTPSSGNFGGSYTTYTNYVYDCRDIMMVKIDAGSNISWLQVLPKSQREFSREGIGAVYTGFSLGYDFFDGSGRPFYAGFGAIQNNNKIQLFFNDSPKNENVLQPGQKVSRVVSFKKTDCFVVSLDEITGKYQRKMFFSNKDVPTAMPRLGSILGTDMYIVGKTDRMLGKTKMAVARISTN